MKYILIKASKPGWTKEFDSKNKAKNHLFEYICIDCMKSDKIQKNSSIQKMLNTSCGLEFDYEEKE